MHSALVLAVGVWLLRKLWRLGVGVGLFYALLEYTKQVKGWPWL